MDSPVKKTIDSFKASHDIEIFDANLSAALSKAIQYGNDDNAISFLINVQPKITVVSTCNGADPRIWSVVPFFSFISRLIIHLDEGMIFVEFTEDIE